MISGKLVRSLIDRTGIPASSRVPAVPPVETISMPRSANPRANSTIPVLSDTDSSARATRTSPGATGPSDDTRLVPCSMAPTLPPQPGGRPIAGGGARPHRTALSWVHHDPARILRIGAHSPAGAQRDRLRKQLVFDRLKLLEHRARVRGVGAVDRA